jgi:hypothetical protein
MTADPMRCGQMNRGYDDPRDHESAARQSAAAGPRFSPRAGLRDRRLGVC